MTVKHKITSSSNLLIEPTNEIKKMTAEVMVLAEEHGINAVRKLLNENGINDRRIENQYLDYLKEIESLLEAEQSSRRFNRIGFVGHANINFATKDYDNCQVENISVVGIFSKGFFQQRKMVIIVLLHFSQKDGSSLKISHSSKVVRKNDTGIGVEFTVMSHESHTFLQAILLYESEDPLSIGFEFPEKSPFEINGLGNN